MSGKKLAVSAAVAQSVERRLGKAEVTGPIPVSSFKVLDFQGLFLLHFMLYHGTFLIFSMFPFGVSL